MRHIEREIACTKEWVYECSCICVRACVCVCVKCVRPSGFHHSTWLLFPTTPLPPSSWSCVRLRPSPWRIQLLIFSSCVCLQNLFERVPRLLTFKRLQKSEKAATFIFRLNLSWCFFTNGDIFGAPLLEPARYRRCVDVEDLDPSLTFATLQIRNKVVLSWYQIHCETSKLVEDSLWVSVNSNNNYVWLISFLKIAQAVNNLGIFWFWFIFSLKSSALDHWVIASLSVLLLLPEFHGLVLGLSYFGRFFKHFNWTLNNEHMFLEEINWSGGLAVFFDRASLLLNLFPWPCC